MREVLVEYIRTSFDMSNDEYTNRLEPIIRAARPERLQKVLFNYFPKDAIGFLVDPAADIACATQEDQRQTTQPAPIQSPSHAPARGLGQTSPPACGTALRHSAECRKPPRCKYGK